MFPHMQSFIWIIVHSVMIIPIQDCLCLGNLELRESKGSWVFVEGLQGSCARM